MVVRVEESTLAVCAPGRRNTDTTQSDAQALVCTAIYEQNRYLFFANGEMLVVLLENMAHAIVNNPRSEAKRPSTFDLWQLWHASDCIQCVSFNNHKRIARGAIAMCMHDGRGVLLMPCSTHTLAADAAQANTTNSTTSSSHAKATIESRTRRASSLLLQNAAASDQVTWEYAKVHLHLHLPTWRESVRWKVEDRSINRIEWVESGEDLLLIGAGEQITIWKIVDDAVQVYFQRSFPLRSDMKLRMTTTSGMYDDPLLPARRHSECKQQPLGCLFDASPSGRFLATAGAYDRIVKVWLLHELAYDAAPVRLFLAHKRALVRLFWTKERHTYKNRSSASSSSGPMHLPLVGSRCEMLFCLDKGGSISIWRETVASSSASATPTKHSFVLWKCFSSQDYLGNFESQYFFHVEDPHESTLSRQKRSQIKMFGLVDHYWARPVPTPTSSSSSTANSISDTLLDESNVLSALCLFHYGYASLEEARRNELYSQRMDGIAKMNAKLLGDRNGATADTHAGETFISGNVPLHKTFSVSLLYGVHANGDLCLFRVEFIPFSGVTPRVSLLLLYSDLQEHLADADIYSISTSDYRDRENGSASFVLEILFQPRSPDSVFKFARLKLQADSLSYSANRNVRGAVCYSVQSCEVSDVCVSVLPAPLKPGRLDGLTIWDTMTCGATASGPAGSASAPSAVLASAPKTMKKMVLSKINDRVDVLRSTYSLSAIQQRPVSFEELHQSVTQTVVYAEQSVIFYVRGRELGAVQVTEEGSSPGSSGHCYAEEEDAEIESLTKINVPETLKKEWRSSMSFFRGSSSSSSFQKDYCMIAGLKNQGAVLVIWVFSFEPATTEQEASTDQETPASTACSSTIVRLYRKTETNAISSPFLSIANLPSMDPYDAVFGSINQTLCLEIWRFADPDELQPSILVRNDIQALIKATKSSEVTSNIQSLTFHQVQETYGFKQFCFSQCDRVAILFEQVQHSTTPVKATKVCIMSVLESCYEAIVAIPEDVYGPVLSIQWTPPLSAHRNCELLVLTRNAVAAIRLGGDQSKANPSKQSTWSIVWSSSRWTVEPNTMSEAFPHVLVGLSASISHMTLNDLSGITGGSYNAAGACSPWPSSVLVESDRKKQSLAGVLSTSFAHHPVQLLFLLMRGSFRSLEKVLDHIQKSIRDHQKSCYMQMTDSADLEVLPLLPLSTLFEPPAGQDASYDERPATFTSTTSTTTSQPTSSSNAPLARASDLFAMNFGASRRLGGGGDRADMLFAPAPAVSVSDSAGTEPQDDGNEKRTSRLETEEYLEFFKTHSGSLTFLTPYGQQVLLSIVSGMKRIVAWERDASRSKDEPALRFQASLLWPTEDHTPKKTDSTKRPSVHAGLLAEEEQQDTQPKEDLTGLCAEQVTWAALSDCQTEILQECVPATTTMTWKLMKQLRLPFWLHSATKLAFYTEKAAQSEFAATKDPFRVALLYVLLGKTRLLANLFKMANEGRIHDLLSNDFNDARWKNAAIKNAYVLKTKQRYELSAAFFLLGGKVQEAVTLAEQADSTLVLPFLIARLSEKWDLRESSGESQTQEFSMTGLSLHRHQFATALNDGASNTSDASGDSAQGICKNFLLATVWRKAHACGDMYMCFLTKYFVGELSEAIECLLTPPNVEMKCVFKSTEGLDPERTMYWQAFAQSLVGATEMVRFLRKRHQSRSLRFTTAMKEQAVRLRTLSLHRLLAMGLNLAAFYQQRDFRDQFQQFTREQPNSAHCVTYIAARHRILANTSSLQSDYLHDRFHQTIEETLTLKSTSQDEKEPSICFEEQMTREMESIIQYCGSISTDEDTSTKQLVFESVYQHFMHSNRTVALDALVFYWQLTEPELSMSLSCASPLPQLLDVMNEKLAMVTSGDLHQSATSPLFSRRMDQTCAELLAIARTLLEWLGYYYNKPVEQRAAMGSAELVRLTAASIYSTICLCCRFVKAPCCLHRALTMIFPHKDALPKKLLDDLGQIAMTDTCINCTTAVKPSSQAQRRPSLAPGASSLQQDIPVLVQIVAMLQRDVEMFAADVKTHRLQLKNTMNNGIMTGFSYCQYWTLLLMLSVNTMPLHVTRLCVDGVSSVSVVGTIGRKLAQLWTNYSNQLCKYAAKYLLCELAESYFRPLTMTRQPSTGSMSSSASTTSAGSTPLPTSPTAKTNEQRQLLPCVCDRCPWLLMLKMFTDKDEFLLRLNAQLDCCSEKLTDEINWGHLPDFPSRKAALTRSQRILLSAAAEKTGRSDLADLLERRAMPVAKVKVDCIYRSEVSIKSLCFNRVNEASEMVLCSSKGICRAASVEYSDGTKFQFKGMYANPQAVFFADGNASDHHGPEPIMRRRTTGALPPTSAAQGSQSNLPTASATVSPFGSPPAPSPPSSADSKTPSFKPTAVESHPILPLFVSGNQKGKVHLWSYDSLSSICSFQTKSSVVASYQLSPTTSGRRDIKKIRFDSLGQQMGAVDTFGRLFMWKFANLDREACYRELDCHDKGAKSLTFLNSGSCVATVGSSSEKRSVCLWDLLLPTSKALIAAPVCHPAGAASIVFSSMHQLLISGGEGGSISVFDVRQRRGLHTISNAHETAITTLELHPSGHCVLSGSASGDIKIWSLPIFREVISVPKVHAKPSFLGDAASNILGDAASNMAINVTNSSWGVTDAIASDDCFYTSGTDGSIQRFKIPSLSKIL